MNHFTQNARKAPRGRFFLMGLAVASALTLAAFEWQTPIDPFTPVADTEITVIEIIEHPRITLREKPKPKPVAPRPPSIVPGPPIPGPPEPDPTPVPDPEFPLEEHPGWFGPETPPVDTVPTIFVVVEEMPSFPGGDKGLLSHLAKNTKYPRIPRNEGIEGKVYVQFVVDTKGNVADVSIERSVNPFLDAEAKRVIESLPKWTPGRQRGQAVSVRMTIPVKFILR